MDYLRIRNWGKWQSWRSDRGQPPWIKLHRCVMRNFEWMSLTDAQRGQLVAIWLLAADRSGVIPASPRIIQKLCNLDSEPDLQLLTELGFIEPDADLTPERRQPDADLTNKSRVEESRIEEKREDSLLGAGSAPEPDDALYLVFPCSGKPKEWELRKSRLDEYYRLYAKQVDVLSECRKARLWLIDNPHRQKTARGMATFLTNWMNRAVNKGGAGPISKAQAKAEAEQVRKAAAAKRRNGTEQPVAVANMVNQVTEQIGVET